MKIEVKQNTQRPSFTSLENGTVIWHFGVLFIKVPGLKHGNAIRLEDGTHGAFNDAQDWTLAKVKIVSDDQ